MRQRKRLCRLDELEVNKVNAFDHEELPETILVVTDGERVFATTSLCPHEDVSLADGSLDHHRITCPGHGYRFDLATGACDHDRSLTLPRYNVSVEGGDVWIDLIPDLRKHPRGR